MDAPPFPRENEALARFHEDGLVWLVNVAVLHPRGWALAIRIDDDGTPVGLSLVGDGSEPWCFGVDPVTGEGQADDAYRRFKAAESRREAEWSPKLRGRT